MLTLQYSFWKSKEMMTHFDHFYSRIVEDSKELTSEPSLRQYKRTPKRFDEHCSQTHRLEDAKSYLRQQCYEALETSSGNQTNNFSKLEECLLQQQ